MKYQERIIGLVSLSVMVLLLVLPAYNVYSGIQLNKRLAATTLDLDQKLNSQTAQIDYFKNNIKDKVQELDSKVSIELEKLNVRISAPAKQEFVFRDPLAEREYDAKQKAVCDYEANYKSTCSDSEGVLVDCGAGSYCSWYAHEPLCQLRKCI